MTEVTLPSQAKRKPSVIQKLIAKTILNSQGHSMQLLSYLPYSLQVWLQRRVDRQQQYAEFDPHLTLVAYAKGLVAQKPLIGRNTRLSRYIFDATIRSLTRKHTPVAHVEEFSIPSGDPSILMLLRHYVPEQPRKKTKLPLLVFFHGGGFMLGNLASADEPSRTLCHHGQMHVLSVDYRLSPEYLAPAAYLDGMAAVKWAYGHAEQLGIDASKICIGGDSAGGNISANVSYMLAKENISVFAQLLIYPIVDFFGKNYPSRQTFSRGFFLSNEEIENSIDFVLGDEDRENREKLYSPMHSDSSMQPKTLLITAAFDALRDEGELYAQKLIDAGGDCSYQRVAGLGHGFMNLTGINRTSEYASVQLAKDFRLLINDELI